MIEALLLWLLLRAFGSRTSSAPMFAPSSAPATTPKSTPASSPSSTPGKVPASAATPLWPSSAPSSLPPFPAGWELDNPPPAEVQRRAVELLPGLWMKGSGTKQTDLTGQRWITYVATYMAGKRGVTAYRRKGDVPAEPTNPAPVARKDAAPKPKPTAVVGDEHQEVATAEHQEVATAEPDPFPATPTASA